ncbi:MAG: hypothetical protein R3Y11_09210 [Pseudomonadota bacterium]
MNEEQYIHGTGNTCFIRTSSAMLNRVINDLDQKTKMDCPHGTKNDNLLSTGIDKNISIDVKRKATYYFAQATQMSMK